MDFIDTLLNQMSSTFNREGSIPIQAEISMDETFKWRALKNNQFASRSKKVRFSKSRLKDKEKIIEKNDYSDSSIQAKHSCTINGLNSNDGIEIEIENDISRAEIREIVAITQGFFSVSEDLKTQPTDDVEISEGIGMFSKNKESNIESIPSSIGFSSNTEELLPTPLDSDINQTKPSENDKNEMISEFGHIKTNILETEKNQQIGDQESSDTTSIFVQMSYAFNGSISAKSGCVERNSIDLGEIETPSQLIELSKPTRSYNSNGLSKSDLQDNLRRSGRLKREKTLVRGAMVTSRKNETSTQTLNSPILSEENHLTVRKSSNPTPKPTRNPANKDIDKKISTKDVNEKILPKNRPNRCGNRKFGKRDLIALRRFNQSRVPSKIRVKHNKEKIVHAISKKSIIIQKQSSPSNDLKKHSVKKSASTVKHKKEFERKPETMPFECKLLKPETQNIDMKPLRRLLNIENNSKQDLSEHKGRLSRPIKLSAKILANAELRHGFELQNSLRLSINAEIENKTSHKNLSSNSLPDIATKLNRTVEKRTRLPAIKYSSINKSLNLTDFLNEIKRQNLGNNRSPENRKLTKKQQKRLLKLKEIHFKMLGLRKNSVKCEQSSNSSVIGDINNTTTEIKIKDSISTVSNTQDVFRVSPRQSTKETFLRGPCQDDNMSHSKLSNNDCLERAQPLTDSSPYREVHGTESASSTNQTECNCYCQKRTRYFITKARNRMMCTATDDVNGETIGCTEELEGELQNFLRVNKKISYQLLCHIHRKRLRHHGCCPVCGIFCTKGVFVLCIHKHLFHRSCAEKLIMNIECISNGTNAQQVLSCPHCGTKNVAHNYIVEPCNTPASIRSDPSENSKQPKRR
ncbi:uncharacterized protein LOC129733013 [Wyeomyia smithii]|uniref:uncharacterized protein LOC129733013 n=1 Tax=Wyeomyia smithii TaxID=174621 RepID=UPI002467BEC9|nr:uncharacterized protein LOC129733013 [Wyeomyia smithii]